MAVNQGTEYLTPTSSGDSADFEMENLYGTPIDLLVGPEQKKAVVHKEILCAKSPSIRRLCEQSTEISRGHQIMGDLHEQLRAVANGPSANLMDPMIAALRNALQTVPEEHYRQLERDIQDCLLKNCRSQAAGSLTVPQDSSFVDWLCVRLRALKPLQVAKVVQSAQSAIFRILSKTKKSSDPRATVSFNTLLLPNSTMAAVQALLLYLYQNRLPTFQSKDAKTLLTICHTNAVAVFLEIHEVANHCMDLLISMHTLLVDPRLATSIIEQALVTDTQKFWRPIRRLMLDILVATDSTDLTDEQVNGMKGVMASLDLLSAHYVAQTSLQRTRDLMKASHTPCGPTPPPPPPPPPQSVETASAVKQEDDTNPSRPLATSAFACPTSFSNPISACKRYHWHFPGQGCFPETKRPEAAAQEKQEDIVSRPESRAPSTLSSFEACEGEVGRKRKREAEEEEREEGEQEGEEYSED